jgi:hypothetical protein
MKKILLLATIFPMSGIWCRAYTITNFDSTIDTNWTVRVIPKLNANNGNFVAWLNSLDASNILLKASITTNFTLTGFVQSWTTNNQLSTTGTNTVYWLATNSLGSAAFASAGAFALSSTTNLNYRSGITNIPTLTTSQSVLFSTPFSPTVGTNYCVNVSFDTAIAAAVGFSTTSKTTNGFTITLSGTITGAEQVDYAAWPYQ